MAELHPHVKARESHEYGYRAMMAWKRSEGFSADQPMSTVMQYEFPGEKVYVVLENRNGILAVYRVRRFDGTLKRLKRWPSELNDIVEGVKA
jgi:hypothetical protein